MPTSSPPIPIPAVIRSRQHLASQGVSFLPQGISAPAPLPIAADGTTYGMAQEAAWLDGTHFAVGRWDGSLSIFSFNDSKTAGPVITKAINTPAFEGVQSITRLAPSLFASSNDDASLCIWSSPSKFWTDIEARTLSYPQEWGAVNSGDAFVAEDILFFVAGHANGFVSIWEGGPDGIHLRLRRAVELRNPHPTNPWDLHNIRGVSVIGTDDRQSYVVTGSEDGYVCIVRVGDGAVLSKTVYNPAAQRGINSVAVMGRRLLVANCSVGLDDKNLWYYEIDAADWSIRFKENSNLRVDPSAPQVFNFCTKWGWYDDAPCFFSSTEEGMLWMGVVDRREQLMLLGCQLVYGHLGSALAFHPCGKLVVVNYNLYEFLVPGGPRARER
jgi:predicted heme/steroid binding protein